MIISPRDSPQVEILLIDDGGDFLSEIIMTRLEPFTHLVTGEPADADLLAGLTCQLNDKFADGHGLILDEWLFEQDGFRIELVETTFNHLVDNVLRFVGILRISQRLTASVTSAGSSSFLTYCGSEAQICMARSLTNR
jgi:hypothetical protein